MFIIFYHFHWYTTYTTFLTNIIQCTKWFSFCQFCLTKIAFSSTHTHVNTPTHTPLHTHTPIFPWTSHPPYKPGGDKWFTNGCNIGWWSKLWVGHPYPNLSILKLASQQARYVFDILIKLPFLTQQSNYKKKKT